MLFYAWKQHELFLKQYFGSVTAFCSSEYKKATSKRTSNYIPALDRHRVIFGMQPQKKLRLVYRRGREAVAVHVVK